MRALRFCCTSLPHLLHLSSPASPPRYVYGSGGRLFVHDVTLEDGQAAYLCRVRHPASLLALTSPPATLTVIGKSLFLCTLIVLTVFILLVPLLFFLTLLFLLLLLFLVLYLSPHP